MELKLCITLTPPAPATRPADFSGGNPAIVGEMTCLHNIMAAQIKVATPCFLKSFFACDDSLSAIYSLYLLNKSKSLNNTN